MSTTNQSALSNAARASSRTNSFIEPIVTEIQPSIMEQAERDQSSLPSAYDSISQEHGSFNNPIAEEQIEPNNLYQSDLQSSTNEQRRRLPRNRNLSPGFSTRELLSTSEHDDTQVPPEILRRLTSRLETGTDLARNAPELNELNSRRTMTRQEKEDDDFLKKKVTFYFMNPYEKWLVTKRVPWKLLIQFIKIIIVTAQLILFASIRSDHIQYQEDTRTTMRHALLANWTDERDINTYPPPVGPLALYTRGGMYESLSNIFLEYYRLNASLFNYIQYRSSNDDFAPVLLAYEHYKPINTNANGVIIDLSPVFDYNLNISLNDAERDALSKNISLIGDYLRDKAGVSLDPNMLIRLELHLSLFTLRPVKTVMRESSMCYYIDVYIEYDNSQMSGMVRLNLETYLSYAPGDDPGCQLLDLAAATRVVGIHTSLIILLDVTVIIVSLLSLTLCARSLANAHLLRRRLEEHFVNVRHEQLSTSDRLALFNGWYAMIIVNDVLVLLGSILKLSLEFSHFNSGYFTATGSCLGIGTLLVWAGVLRYLGFFTQYNILILTLKKSLPSVARFMVCAIVLYMGFMLCGWVILGPYSLKFRTLFNTFSCMFALVNGDDMFATFYTMNANTPFSVLLISRFYLFTFIALFIYVVLSLFISIIMDAYEIVKDRFDTDEKCSPLARFIAEPNAPVIIENSATPSPSLPSDTLFLTDERQIKSLGQTCHDAIQKFCPCFRRSRRSRIVSEYEPIDG